MRETAHLARTPTGRASALVKRVHVRRNQEGDCVGYAALTDVWGANGLAAVTFSLLEDAGFCPVVECDSRGWMHFCQHDGNRAPPLKPKER